MQIQFPVLQEANEKDLQKALANVYIFKIAAFINQILSRQYKDRLYKVTSIIIVPKNDSYFIYVTIANDHSILPARTSLPARLDYLGLHFGKVILGTLNFDNEFRVIRKMCELILESEYNKVFRFDLDKLDIPKVYVKK
jgi:hypothetical protein